MLASFRVRSPEPILSDNPDSPPELHLSVKAECQPPISIYLNRPMTRQLLLERVKIPSRDIHPGWTRGSIQRGHLVSQLLSVRRVDSCLRASPEELLQPRVPERLDHSTAVSLIDTAVNGKATSSRQVLTSVRNFPHECFTKKQQLSPPRTAEIPALADTSRRVHCADARGMR
jgi:hypothetical protein